MADYLPRSTDARIMASIRRCDPDLADAIDREEMGMEIARKATGEGLPVWLPAEYKMSDELQARLDAWLYGQGYLINGRRIDPSTVMIVRTSGGSPGRRRLGG